MRINLLLALAGVSSLALGLPARAAEKRDFHQCDGLSTPGKGGQSGMAIAAQTGGFLSSFGSMPATVIKSCTAALADPRLQPHQTLRRAHLLRARALANLQAGNTDAALADVDAAAATAGPLTADPLFARSMGASFELIRAAVQLTKGNSPEASRLALAAAARRPYSASIQSAAFAIVQRARDAGASSAASLAGLARIIPDAVKLQFVSEANAGNFAAAAAMYDRLPKPAAAMPVLLFNTNTLLEPITIAGLGSYAFAAAGRPERARALLAEARTRLDAQFAPSADGKANPWVALTEMAGLLRGYLDRSATLTEARIAIAEGRASEALKQLVGVQLPVSAASVELLTALKAALPADQRTLAPDPAVMAAKLAENRKTGKIDAAALRRSMPAPEAAANLADYQKASSGLLYSFFVGSGASSDGFKSKTDPATGITKVEFVGNGSSQPTVEELTLLRAADLARQAGKPGLLIVGRRDFTRTLQVTQGYSRIPISSSPAGYKSELDVRFVDPAAMPADLAGERDRVLDANSVWNALAPIYIPVQPLDGKVAARP